MHIWEFHDFFFAALWALLAAGFHRLTKWLKEQIERDSTITDKEAKFCRYGLLVLRLLVLFAAVCCVGTIALPLLDALLAALLGTASDLFNKYGGLLLLVVVAILLRKNRQTKADGPDDGEVDPVEVELSKQEADELHDDIAELIFNAIIDTETVEFKKPRSKDSIAAGKETPFVMDGIMAVHRFWVDINSSSVKFNEDFAVRQLQRHTNQQGKRYPQLYRDGRAPIIFDIKNNGDFAVIEVVLYSEKYKNKIEARRKARIARQQMMGDSHDRDF